MWYLLMLIIGFANVISCCSRLCISFRISAIQTKDVQLDNARTRTTLVHLDKRRADCKQKNIVMWSRFTSPACLLSLLACNSVKCLGFHIDGILMYPHYLAIIVILPCTFIIELFMLCNINAFV